MILLQSVGDSVRGSSDSMGNATNSEQEGSSSTAAAASATSEGAANNPTSTAPFVSLVERAFGGKIRTTYTCGKCATVSMHKETFTVLHLAIPDEGKSEKVLQNVLQCISDDYICYEQGVPCAHIVRVWLTWDFGLLHHRPISAWE